MTLSWLPVIWVDVLGSAVTLVLAFFCTLRSWRWTKKRSEDSFRHYIFLLTLSFVFFAVSRSFGHLVKQTLLFFEMNHIWKQIAPFSGSINTATFITVFAFGIYFHRSRKVYLELELHKNNLEELIEERTAELERKNILLKDEISERTQAEIALKESEDRLKTIIASVHTGIMIIDAETHEIVDVNPVAAAMIGAPREEIVNQVCHKFVCPAELNKCPITDLGQTVDNSERVLLTKKGEGIPILKTVSPVVLGGREHLVESFLDLSERKQAEEKIHSLAYYDSLTGLPNRTFFKELLARALLYAKRNKLSLAILFIDLDYFKRINDTFGHNVGDELLQAVAKRLGQCLRQSDHVARSDEGEATNHLSRLGGDEFVISLQGIAHPQDAGIVARRIVTDISQPFSLGAHEVFVSPSIGISLYPSDGKDVDTLVKNADTAMYHAKDHGRKSYHFYEESMNVVILERITLENKLRMALDRKEFILYFQPKVEIKNRKISGIEALIRWQDPDRGLLLPEEFLYLAEETGLIVPIGEWVLRSACLQNKAWQEAGLPPVKIAVNLSSRQFDQKTLVETVTKALNDAGIDPQYLELEITESMIIKNPERTRAILHELKSMGIQISVDDFGTGYSSLSYLQKFPLDTLKIDRTFVKNITTRADDVAITKAIIAMAHSLNLKVIAEGVETKQQLQILHELECEEAQGYLFSRPVTAEKCLQLLKEGSAVQILGPTTN